MRIAKNNQKTRKRLLPIIDKIIVTEKNKGVKKVYAKALKTIEKKQSGAFYQIKYEIRRLHFSCGRQTWQMP